MLVKAGMEFFQRPFRQSFHSWHVLRHHGVTQHLNVKANKQRHFSSSPPPTHKAPSQINGFVVSIHCLSVQSNLPYRWKINTVNSKVIYKAIPCLWQYHFSVHSIINLNWSRPARTTLGLYFMARRHPGTLIVQNPVLAYWFALSSALVTGRIHFRLRPQFRIFPHVSETCYHVSLSIQI